MKRRIVFPNGEDAIGTLTVEQVTAIDKLRERWPLPETVEVTPMFASDCVMVDVGSMWLGVEKDGYTHS
jgi:hypothetical protein